jgi:iron(III) transport system substrate-binding protein
MTNMPQSVLVRAVAVGAVSAVALAFGATAPSAQTMEQVIEGAKKEGELIIHVGPGKAFRDGRLNGFTEKYPFIKVHAINTANRESMPKLIRERQAGIYALDVHFGGPPNLIRVYKPQGFLAPFRDAIVDKSVMDDKVWRGGFAGGFMDKESKFIYGYNQAANNPMHVNWANMSKSDLKGLDDLLSPKLAGKIVWHDPRSPGPGFAAAMTIYYNKGEDFLKKLWAQPAVYTNNRRQAAEWVVRGRNPVGLGTARDFMLMFEKQGLGKQVEEMPAEWIATATMSSGNGNVVYMDRAPHPNAAKLYINWFLQREQQQQWNQHTDGVSRRVDTKPNNPQMAPQPGKKYIDIFHESRAGDVATVLRLARENIKAAQDKEGD